MKKSVVVVVLLVCLVTLFAVTAAPASATVFPPKSPGYWMSHPGAWLNGGVEIGGVCYTTTQAIALMKAPAAGDKRYSVFQVLAAAEQNQAHGAGPYWERSMQTFMATYGPLPGGIAVRASSAAFQSIEPAYLETCAWWD